MAKRRTRKQKESAKHTFTVSWGQEQTRSSSKAKTSLSEPTVKGQIKNGSNLASNKPKQAKNANSMVKDTHLGSIKRDIVKSLSLALVIVGLELVIYLALNR
jgi:hypothetical protein